MKRAPWQLQQFNKGTKSFQEVCPNFQRLLTLIAEGHPPQSKNGAPQLSSFLFGLDSYRQQGKYYVHCFFKACKGLHLAAGLCNSLSKKRNPSHRNFQEGITPTKKLESLIMVVHTETPEKHVYPSPFYKSLQNFFQRVGPGKLSSSENCWLLKLATCVKMFAPMM